MVFVWSGYSALIFSSNNKKVNRYIKNDYSNKNRYYNLIFKIIRY